MYSRVGVAILGSTGRLLEGLVIVGRRGFMCRRSRKILSNSSIGLSEGAGHSFHAGHSIRLKTTHRSKCQG